MKKDQSGSLLFSSLLSLPLESIREACRPFSWDNANKGDFTEGREIHLTKFKEKEQRQQMACTRLNCFKLGSHSLSSGIKVIDARKLLLYVK